MHLKTCVLIVDEVPRDFLAQVLLGLRLVARGFRVVISTLPPTEVLRAFPQAVFLGKRGFRIGRPFPAPWVMQPAEGAFFPESHWVESVTNKYFLKELADSPPDIFLAWGDEQAAVIRRHFPNGTARVVVAGCERFDLCLPSNQWFLEEQVHKINQLFPDFILVTTRFTTVLAPSPAGKISSLMRYYSEISGTKRASQILSDQVQLDAVGLGLFVSFLTHLLDSFPTETFVLRPHPSESQEFYRQLFQHYRNLVVERSGNVLPWVKASKLVITSGSTVAVEAVIAEKPVVNFVPAITDQPGLRVAVASMVGHVVHNAAEGADVVCRVLDNDEPLSPDFALAAASRLANLEGPAIDRIAASLESLTETLQATESPGRRCLQKAASTGSPFFFWPGSQPLRSLKEKRRGVSMGVVDVRYFLRLARIHGGVDADVTHELPGLLVMEPSRSSSDEATPGSEGAA